MNWDWLSFIIGVLVGLVLAWLIDYFFLRSRRGDLQTANASLQAQLDEARAGQSDLQGQVARCQDSLSAREGELATANARLESAEADAQAAAASAQESLAAQERAAAGCAEALKAKEGELAAITARLADAESALEAVRTDQAAAETRAQDLAARLAAAEAAIPVEPQDLTRVEGIGPKIAELLNDAGIVNYAQLADAALDRLHEILGAAGPRFRIANPASWSQQARLAAEEKWDELDALQDRLTAGRVTGEQEEG